MSDSSAANEIFSIDTNTMPWQEMRLEAIDASILIKGLMADPDTGMSVAKIRYRAGFTNDWHRHNCAHGIYVLDGVLQTHAGAFGPGSFAWFPEGIEMQHGATQDNDVTMLFITNKPFDVHYRSEGQQHG
ncbi:MAG: cupin domain-containing protein [Pseudomonadota bacterium]